MKGGHCLLAASSTSTGSEGLAQICPSHRCRGSEVGLGIHKHVASCEAKGWRARPSLAKGITLKNHDLGFIRVFCTAEDEPFNLFIPTWVSPQHVSGWVCTITPACAGVQSWQRWAWVLLHLGLRANGHRQVHMYWIRQCALPRSNHSNYPNDSANSFLPTLLGIPLWSYYIHC